MEEKWLRALFDRVLPDRSWDMPVERELPSKIGWCNEELAGHNFDLKQNPLERIFYIYMEHPFRRILL